MERTVTKSYDASWSALVLFHTAGVTRTPYFSSSRTTMCSSGARLAKPSCVKMRYYSFTSLVYLRKNKKSGILVARCASVGLRILRELGIPRCLYFTPHYVTGLLKCRYTKLSALESSVWLDECHRSSVCRNTSRLQGLSHPALHYDRLKSFGL